MDPILVRCRCVGQKKEAPDSPATALAGGTGFSLWSGASPALQQLRANYFRFCATKSQLTTFQNASTYLGRALR